MKLFQLGLACCFLSAACATSTPHIARPITVHPLQPRTAGELLEQGFAYAKVARSGQAASAFRNAIATGQLNDAGRALAYWHIFYAEKSAENLDQAMEALSSFIVVAEDLMALELEMGEPSDFGQRFGLGIRLARARAILSTVWAARRPDYGRSLKNPIRVADPLEITYFLQMAPECENTDKADFAHLDHDDADGSVQQVTVQCEPTATAEHFYFSY